MAVEDFSTYTKLGDYTVATSKVSWTTSLTDTAEAYVGKDFGAAYWGDFSVTLDSKLTRNENSEKGFWNLTSGATAGLADLCRADMDTNNEGLSFHAWCQWNGFENVDYHLQDFDGDSSDSATDITNNTVYYCTFARVAATSSTTVKIYSDSGRTTLVDTMTITYNADTYRYAGVANPNTGGQWNKSSGYVDNVTITVGGAAVDDSQVFII